MPARRQRPWEGGGELHSQGVLASSEILALGWPFSLLWAGRLIREIRAERPLQGYVALDTRLFL